MKANARSERRDATYDRLVRQEELILDVTERLTEALRDTGMTRAELARRLGRTPGFVSQVFAGGRNLTLRTISDVAAALSLRPALELSPVRESAPQPVQWRCEAWPPTPRMVTSYRGHSSVAPVRGLVSVQAAA